ncbi:hypothetical protein Taro_048230 [Colocasia esculenta]|uniref:Gnk2-homologous domain-containing protein n=1 Tax=Colocasia esculenta TaxID=4460 RepID=A0A843WXV1_COLES|nr:hypothetical protein [Colocasia esculenta]
MPHLPLLLPLRASITMAPLLSERSPLLLISLLLLLTVHSPSAAAAEENPIFAICPNTGNYTSNSTFRANLDRLLSSLLSAAPPTGFSNDTVGRGADRVHGLALCRGDSTAAQCRECLAGAVDGVVKNCPYRKHATIWYETCHLRYSNESFFGSPTGPQFYMWNMNNVSDPAGFGQLLGGLLDGLTSRAAYAPPMFAAGDVGSSGGGRIYGLVQCTRDLSAEGCNRCLREEIRVLPTCCYGKKGGRVIGGSCYLRYEVRPFYNASAAVEHLPPLPAPSASPPLSAPSASPPLPHTPATSPAPLPPPPPATQEAPPPHTPATSPAPLPPPPPPPPATLEAPPPPPAISPAPPPPPPPPAATEAAPPRVSAGRVNTTMLKLPHLLSLLLVLLAFARWELS